MSWPARLLLVAAIYLLGSVVAGFALAFNDLVLDLPAGLLKDHLNLLIGVAMGYPIYRMRSK
jgi:uncharacterized oligopeptide transporter (OPT) family protein